MNETPPIAIIQEVVNNQVLSRVNNILWQNYTAWLWNYTPVAWWANAKNVCIVEYNWRKVILKIWDKKLLKDVETEESLSELGLWTVPKIILRWTSTRPWEEDYFWVVQEFIPGMQFQDYIKTSTLSDEQKRNLVYELWKIHQVKPQKWLFGKILDTPETTHGNFLEYIEYFENFILISDGIPWERKERILSIIKMLKGKINPSMMHPHLIHGDFHDRNILVWVEQEMWIIDFWDAKWWIRETEFAIMFTHSGALENLELYRDILRLYETEFWPLDKDLFDLCCLCSGAMKTIKRFQRNSPDPGVWEKILAPIIEKRESEFTDNI